MSIFKDTREFAGALKGVSNFDLRLLPYDRYQSENTEWWLLPKKTENPAYKYGKIFIENTTNENKYFCGFCFEKGYKNKLACESSSKVLQPDWDWNKFVKKIRSKDEELNNIFENIVKYKLPCNINISYDVANEKNPSSFNMELAKNLTFVNSDLQNLKKEHSVFDIISIIENKVGSSKMKWTWIDLKIGVFLDKKKSINEMEIWRDCLEPWQNWLKE